MAYLKDPFFNSLGDSELEDIDVAFLPEAMSAIECLVLSLQLTLNSKSEPGADLKRRVPPHVNEDYIITAGQVQPWSARSGDSSSPRF
jgi:hypothetical protein